MERTLELRGFLAKAMSLVTFLFVLISVAFVGCTTEEFDEVTKTKPEPPVVVIPGDTIPSFDTENTFRHGDWEVANGLIQRENKNYGYINLSVKKDGKVTVIGSDPLDKKVKTSFSWTPVEEIQGKTQLTYLGSNTTKGTTTSAKDGKLTMKTTPFTSTLKFEEMEVVFKGSFERLFAGSEIAEGCDFDSLKYEIVKTDTLPEIIKKEDGDYKRGETTAKLIAYLTHTPGNEVHVEEFPFKYTGIFRVNLEPGEKVYQGKKIVEGSDKYYPMENGNFWSERTYIKTFIQDEKTITEEVKFGGEARIIWGVPAGNTYTVEDINIGNPNMVPSFEDAKNFIERGKGLKAIVRTYSFPFAWANGYAKTNTCAVDMLSAYDEDDTYALPTGESSMSFANYVAGNPTTETDFTVYFDGVLFFKGLHSNASLNATKEYPLEKAQVFQVKINKVFVGYHFVTTFDKTTGASKIEAYEIWRDEPKKLVATYETTMTQRAYGDETVRFFGSSLSFISGLSKSVSEPKASDYKAEGNGVFAASIKTSWSARLNLGTTNFYHERSKKYVMHGEKQVFFEGYDEPTVGSFGDSNISLINTNDNYVEDGEKYTRRSYNATLTINGKDVVNVINVDKLAPKDPTIDLEFGYLDWDKTKQFGGLSWAWDVEMINGKPTLKPVLNVTVVTTVGVMNKVAGTNYFYKMDVNTITSRLGAGLNVGTGNKWIPSSIEVKDGSTGNPYWYYMGVDGKSTTSVNGVDILKIEDVKLNEPFFNIPVDGSTTFSNKNGHVVVTYKGEVVFDEIFPVK